MNLRINYFLCMSIVLGFFASACFRSGALNVTETPNGNQSEFIPQFETATLVPTATAIPYATLIASPDYMAECRNISTSDHGQQVDYRGIFAGQTTLQEVLESFGEPENKAASLNTWYYNSFRIIFRQETVEIIHVDEDLIELDLLDYINRYGCPSFIVGLDYWEIPVGNYQEFFIVYLDAGLALAFVTKPNLTDFPTVILYFQPATFDEYFSVFDGSPDHINNTRIFDWHEIFP